MDEHRTFPEASGQGLPGDERIDVEQATGAERLVARLAELREQLEIVAPEDQARGREALDRLRHDHERITTLEELLATARERERDLTTQVVRDRTRIAESEGRISELSAVAARLTEADGARRRAEGAAAEREREAALARTEVDALRAELERARSRTSELEADAATMAEEIAAATLARTEAARLRAERDEARERASIERRLAAEDRLRATEANVRVTELARDLRAAERRIVHLTNERRAVEVETPAAQEGPHAEAIPAPWIQLQRVSAEAGSSTPSSHEPAVERAEDAGTAEASPDTERTPTSQPDLWAASEPSLWEPPAVPPTDAEPLETGEDLIDLTASDDTPETDAQEPGSEDAPTPPAHPEHNGSGGEGLWQILRRRRG